MKGFPTPPEGRSKVLLVFPKLFPKKTYQEDEYLNFPLSVLQLAAALKKDNVDVSILDGRVEENYREKILTLKDELLVVGFSCLTGQVSQGLEIANFVRENVPEIPIVWGGWHPTIFHKESIQSPCADVIARGEGEDIIRELVKCLRNGSGLSGINGITYKVNGDVSVNPDRALMKDFKMEKLPYELLDHSRYEVKEGRISIITSRGCPQNCAYCSIQSYYTRHWYGRDAMEIADQIEYLKKRFNVDHFIFQDSNFFVDPRRTKAISEEIIKRDLKITWEASGHTKVLVRTEKETYELVKRSGCRQISVGVESGSPRMLNIIHKGLKLEEVFNLAKLIVNSKITFRTNFIIGMPGETDEDLLQTFDVIRKLHKSCPNLKVSVYMYHPIPGSPMYEEERQSGQIIDYPTSLEEWAKFKIESDVGWDATRPWRGKDLIENYRNRDHVRAKSFYLWAGCLGEGFERNLPSAALRLGYRFLHQLAAIRLNTGTFSLPFEWWIYQYYRHRK
jgi:radical SAM superfamily enzyme YgiQ (UPF0313 family)